MLKRAAIVALLLAAGACGGGDSTSSPSPATSPSNSAAASPFNSFSTSPTPPSSGTISFAGLGAAANRSPISAYTELGFTVATTSGSWLALTSYGKPAPFIEFEVPGGTTAVGAIQITAGGATFAFRSVDLYSSTTKIPYTITGLRNSATTFTLADTVPNTFGNFKTVINPQAGAAIDTLTISLTNPAAPCCTNPVGVDNIVVVVK
jgi:hypothetical protein